LLDIADDALGANHAGMFDGIVDMDEAGHGFFPFFKTLVAELPEGVTEY
jgi:hypothetical protein